MTYQRFTGPNDEYKWRVSPWDHLAHAHRKFGEVCSQAICEHRARTSTLIADDGTAPECLGCIVAIAREVTGPPTGDFRKPPPVSSPTGPYLHH